MDQALWAYGRMASTEETARLILEAATISIARVIFRVLLMDFIRRLISRVPEAIFLNDGSSTPVNNYFGYYP